jgi:hypothetical protein
LFEVEVGDDFRRFEHFLNQREILVLGVVQIHRFSPQSRRFLNVALVSFSLFSESGRTLGRFGSIIESCFAAAERVDALRFPLFVRVRFERLFVRSKRFVRFEQTAGGASRRFGAIPFIISNFSRVDNSRDAKIPYFCASFVRPATSFAVLFCPS